MNNKNKQIVILGATSAIAKETARKIATEIGGSFLLVARDEIELLRVKADLLSHGAKNVQFINVQDLSNISDHLQIIDQIKKYASPIDHLLIAYGVMEDQKCTEIDPTLALKEIHINYASYVSWLILFAGLFKNQGFGTIGVVSSVAGDIGRRKNYSYGSTKAALNVYTQGLAAYLKTFGVRVLLIKPGMIKTPLSLPFIKPSSPLVCSANKAGEIIAKNLLLGEKREIYVPGFWRYIMLIIKLMPRWLLDRLNI